MSVAFVQQKNRMPPNPTQIQKILDENSQLIQCIVDYQNKGKPNECGQYQQILHRNLVYLASIADASQNIQALLPPPQGGHAGPPTHMPQQSGPAQVPPLDGPSSNGAQSNVPPGMIGANAGQGPPQMHGMHGHSPSYAQGQGQGQPQQQQHHVAASANYMRPPIIQQGQALPPGQQYPTSTGGPMPGQYPGGQQYSVGQQYPAGGSAMPPPAQQGYPQGAQQQGQYRPQQAGYPPQSQQPTQYGQPANPGQAGSFIAPNHQQHGHQNYGSPASQPQPNMNYSGQVGGYGSNPTPPSGTYIPPQPSYGPPQGQSPYNQAGPQASPAPTPQGSYRPPLGAQSSYVALPPSTLPSASAQPSAYGGTGGPAPAPQQQQQQAFTPPSSQPQQAYGPSSQAAGASAQGYPPTSGVPTSQSFPPSQGQGFVSPMLTGQDRQGFGPPQSAPGSQSGSAYGAPAPQPSGYNPSGGVPGAPSTYSGAPGGPPQPPSTQPSVQQTPASTASITPQQPGGPPAVQQGGQSNYGQHYGPSPPQGAPYSHYRPPSGPTSGASGQAQHSMPPPPSSSSPHPSGGAAGQPGGQRPYMYEQNQYPSYQPQ